MENEYLLLWLEAPLQAWGADSKFGRRDSLPFPTKSGIAGLLLCAMGASGEQRELLGRLQPMRQTVIAYTRARQGKDGLSEKMDREPLLRDFHMVGSGYDDQDPWQTLLIPKTSGGKKAVGGGTKMTFRYYLQDAAFAVILELPPDLASSSAHALQNPVYDLYLGRKNCVPTEFIYQGIYKDEETAMEKASQLMRGKNLAEDFRVLDGEHEGDAYTLNDVPVQFGRIKKYRDRRITILHI